MIALVTGASKGIGAACAHALSTAGHRVALVARDGAALRRVAAALPGEALVVPADLLEAGAIDEVFARVEEEWGPVEILVVNAGASMSATAGDAPPTRTGSGCSTSTSPRRSAACAGRSRR